MRVEKDNLVNGTDSGVVMPENAVGGHRRSDGAVTGTEAGKVASKADKSGEVVAGENQTSDEVADPSSDEQVFKSTEIYKTESQKREDVFEKERTKKEKMLEWVKEHKKSCVLIGAMSIVVVFGAIILIIILINNNSQETETIVEVEEAEQIVSDDNGFTSENIGYQEINNAKEMEAIVAFYDTEIAEAATDEEKAELYSQRAAQLYAWYAESIEGMGEQIIADAKKSDELNPTSNSAYLVGFYIMVLDEEEEQAEEWINLSEERGSAQWVEGDTEQ